jgi:FkbM family methyltransferase
MKLSLTQKFQIIADIPSDRGTIKRLLVRKFWRNKPTFDLDFAGIKARYSTEDFYSNYWFYGPQNVEKAYEPAITTLIVEHVKRAKAFADIGANLGYFTVVAGVANKSIPIYSFEIDQTLSPIIAKNVQLNSLSNVSIEKCAVGDGSIKSVPYQPHPFKFLGVIAEENLNIYDLKLSAPVVRLDDYFKNKSVRPNFIKMDIDGAEMSALRGMESLLAQDDIVMLLEVHFMQLPMFGSNTTEVEKFLKDRKFRFYRIGDFRSNPKVELLEINNFKDLKTKSGDMLFVTRKP